VAASGNTQSAAVAATAFLRRRLMATDFMLPFLP
jgi:hypothetical protein